MRTPWRPVWWTLTTISRVGYGDRYPVPPEGRVVAAALMVAGIALLGIATASIASWFVEHLRQSSERTEPELGEAEQKIDLLLDEVRRLSARLDALERSQDGPAPADRSGRAPR
jgi:voltage-gated potassium channel